MTRTLRIAPSLLSADFGYLAEEVGAIATAGADLIHLDVMDGHFVPNITIGPSVVKALRPHTSLPFDVHLMISPAGDYIGAFADAGADIITIHAELSENVQQIIDQIHRFKKKAGIAINPDTSPGNIEKFLHNIDSVLVMTVHPGFGGQQFIDSQLEKIKNIRKQIDASERDIDLAVDGGVSAQNAASIVQAGANVLVAGTAVFAGRRDNYHENIAALRGAA